MGKKTAEEYYVQRGGKWVPVDLGGGSEVLGTKSSASEEYYIQRNGKWVKVGGVKSKEDLIAQLGGGQQQQQHHHHGGSPAQYRRELQRVQVTAPAPAPVAPTILQAPQEPLEYREYFITVNPRPPEPEPVVEPPRMENEYVERPSPRPLQRHRIPPEPEPIIPEQRPVYRRSPPRPLPPPIVVSPPHPLPPPVVVPPATNIYQVHHHYPPPPPPMEPLPPPRPPPPPPSQLVMEPRVEWDAFEMGRRAFYEGGAAEYDDDDDGDDDGGYAGAPRTDAAPGYYLAGYLYYGDPSQAPALRPLPGF